MALTNSNSPVMPTLDELMRAHKTLGDLLMQHYKVMTGDENQDGTSTNNLMPMLPQKPVEQIPSHYK